MPFTTWLAMAHIFGIAFNMGLALRTLRRARADDAAFAAIKARMDAIMPTLLPAVGVCVALAADEHAPREWRAAAQAAIPDGIGITVSKKGPLVSPSDPHRVH